MEEVEALDEGVGAAECGDQRRHVAGCKEGVEPDGSLVGLAAGWVEVAASEVEERAAENGVLEVPDAIGEFGL